MMRGTLKLACLAGTAMACSTASAQFVMNSVTPGTFTDISATGTALTPNNIDDGTAAIVSTVTNALVTNPNLYVCTNGFISDSASFTTFTNGAIPNTSCGLGLYPFWDDLYTTNPGVLYAKSSVEGGANVYIVEWFNVNAYPGGGPTASFECKIWGAGGPALVQYLYGPDMSFGATANANGASATVGVQWTTTNGIQYSANSPVIQNNMVLSVVGSSGSGACCASNGSCSVITGASCLSGGGTYNGDNTTCAQITCPQPGACCTGGGACSQLTQAGCLSAGGIFSGAGVTCQAAACPNQYLLDDGTMEDAVGFGGTSGNGLAYLNQFVSGTGADKITGIQVAFGITDVALNGLTVTAYLWSDPNQDGNPSDAHVLAQANGVIAGATATLPNNSPTFVNFDIPDTTVPVGQKFFVGFVINNAPASYPCGLDETTPHHLSWIAYIAAGSVDPNNLGGVTVVNEDVIAPGNWTIRATAAASAPACYANCDGNTTVPFLNVADFTCFLQKFAQGNAYANCDNSTSNPTLNVADFTCFLQKFAQGCSAP